MCSVFSSSSEWLCWARAAGFEGRAQGLSQGHSEPSLGTANHPRRFCCGVAVSVFGISSRGRMAWGYHGSCWETPALWGLVSFLNIRWFSMAGNCSPELQEVAIF